MAATLTPTKPTCSNRQPQWLLASLATAAFTMVLAGCAPTTSPGQGPPVIRRPPITLPPGHCIDTAEHGCISGAEFEFRRDRIAREHLADPEYQQQSHQALVWINAHQAHAALEVVHGSGTKPGEGVTIGVIDSGVDLNHYELAGAQLEEFLLQGVPDETANDPRGFSHGTEVTGVIAAQPESSVVLKSASIIGLAWGADFKVFAAPISGLDPNSYPGGYDPRTYDWAQAYRTVLASGVDIVNSSYYAVGIFVENYTAAQLRAALPQLKAVAQAGVAEPAIFVWAAGNDNGAPCSPQSDENCITVNPTTGRFNATSPSLLGGAVARLPELQGHNVVVAALAEDGSIADYSNRCGIAADWCIAAPGTSLIVAYSVAGGSASNYAGRQGTSYATPLVTGGLALMKQLFRDQLSHRELVTRLFATADKRGRYTDSATYGQGALDLGAAVSPVGTPLVRTSSLAGAGQSIQATRLRLGSALGDGFSRSAAGIELAAFDELGAPFWFGLPSLTELASTPSSLERLRELMAPPASNSLLDLAGATTTTRVASGLELRFTDPTHRSLAEPGMGAMLSWQPRPFGVRIGWLGEGETLLGSKAAGAFGQLSANTLITGFELRFQTGGWSLTAAAELGWTLAEYGGGIISDLSGLTSTSFSLHASHQLTDTDRLTLSLSQPPRLEQGLASLNLPIGRTQGGRVRYRSVAAELTPSGRELNLAASWQREQLLGGTLQTELGLSDDPGHLETEPSFSLAAGWSVVF